MVKVTKERDSASDIVKVVTQERDRDIVKVVRQERE